jgi:hypothetical protein
MPVVTKKRNMRLLGNDAGFIRVRKRKLKGGHPDWRAYRARQGSLATTSMSFDLVRAVRVNGKPRHEFILSLGSLKDYERHGVVWFWIDVVRRLTRHGLDADQRKRLAAEMVRKGARLPTADACNQYDRNWRDWLPHNQTQYHIPVDEIRTWLHSDQSN